ncbi:MAG TPA: exodeoxyribonuclease VII large subunit [Candidatus Marinimicrobia bacterium]|nr:exodeoxyribonuclease VII large subunit [Candidatus Neomarinimicrobiota bacterium]
MMDSHQAVTVSELTMEIKSLLEGAFPEIWVEGEISNFIHHSSGHMYFTLKDSESEIRSVMFRGNNRFMHFKPENGMKVLLFGRLSVYAPRGQYQLVASRMEPAGIGTLFLAFEALKKQLSAEGLFDKEFKKPLPVIPKRIGLITSKTGAAVQDMFNVLKRRAPYVELVLRPALVQGDDAADDIVSAITEMDQHANVDVIIVGRGGGSLEDLWPFNEESVARAIFSCKTPIISAVGHETDISISDMVSDMRAPTPSAAAEIVAPGIDELLKRIQTFENTISKHISFILENYYQKMDSLHDRFTQQRPDILIDRMRVLNQHLNVEMKQLIHMKFQEDKSRFDKLVGELSILNPKSILDRGYAIATDKKGCIILDPREVAIGESFRVQLSKGILAAKREKNSETNKEAS